MFTFIFLVMLLNIAAAVLCLGQPFAYGSRSTMLNALGALNVICALFNLWRLVSGTY